MSRSASPTGDELRRILESVTTIAVVGMSTHLSKAAHHAPVMLIDAGYTVIPVHPSAEEIAGCTAYRSLRDIPVPVDVVDIFRPSRELAGVASQAVAIEAPVVWAQLGLRSPEARAIAEEAGATYIEDVCMGALVQRLGVHPPDTPGTEA